MCGAACLMAKAGGGSRGQLTQSSATGCLCLTAGARGGALEALWRSRRVTTVHAASGSSRSFVGGAFVTSGGQRVLAQPSGTSIIALLDLVVVGVGWRLVGPRPVGPAIGDAVRGVVLMAKMGRK